jgi:polysaccharide export outer membrane protein
MVNKNIIIKYNILSSNPLLFLNILVLFIFSSSCSVTKTAPPFFRANLDTTKVDKLANVYQVIQKGDLLDIQIYSDNPATTEIYNQAGKNTATALPAYSRGMTQFNSSSSNGYLVDADGNIHIHGLGKIKAEGLSSIQLQDKIRQSFIELGVLTNPYSLVRFNNFKITVVGEVTSPGVFTIPSGKLTIFDAIGMAGDVTLYGKRNDVVLVREYEGKRSYAYIDLTDPRIFNSPNYYLRQNDLLIIQAAKDKVDPNQQLKLQTISIVVGAISALAILITLFR